MQHGLLKGHSHLVLLSAAGIHAAAMLINTAKHMQTIAKLSLLFNPGIVSCVMNYAAYMSKSLQIFGAILVFSGIVAHNTRMPFRGRAPECCLQSLDTTDTVLLLLLFALHHGFPPSVSRW
jgi:hypothetical protein